MNEKKLEGYLLDEKNRILGEVKNFDSYTRKGDIKLYETPLFSSYGYLPKNIKILSELEIKKDESLRKELEITKYESWKHTCLTRLIYDYDKVVRDPERFERFCRDIYKMVNEEGDD